MRPASGAATDGGISSPADRLGPRGWNGIRNAPAAAANGVGIEREKRIKKWLRVWKLELIEKDNLARRDLAEDFAFAPLEPTGSPRSRG